MEYANETSSKAANIRPQKSLAKKKAAHTHKKVAPAKPKVKAAKKVATAETKPVKEKGKKKILREQIADTLETTFSGLKESLGEKKFSQHIKKASKVLAAGAIKKTKNKEKRRSGLNASFSYFQPAAYVLSNPRDTQGDI